MHDKDVTRINDLPKTAVIGADGYLGSAFYSEYRKLYPDCVGTIHHAAKKGLLTLDLSSPDIGPLKLSKTGHKDALILAAITGINKCEQEKDLTRKINVKGTLELIKQLVDEGIKPIFFSTDYVFDGIKGGYSEEDTPNPITEYGREKAEVEEKIASLTRGNYLVIRLSKVFSLNKGDGTLLDEMAGILFKGGIVKAAYDQIFCPTYIMDVIKAVSFLQAKGVTGIVNVCSPEVWTRYNIAQELAKTMGKGIDNVQKVSLDEVSLAIKRPKNTSLLTEKIKKEYNINFMPLKESIYQVAENWKE